MRILLQSRTDEAIPWLERGRSANPENPYHHAFLASAYGLKGDTEHAVAELAEARRLRSDDFLSSIAYVKKECCGRPKVHPLYEGTYLARISQRG